MTSSTWSKGLHVTDVDVFHTCNWTVCCMYWTGVSGVGSTGFVGSNVTIRLSEAPVRLHYTCPIYHPLYSNWEGFKDPSISADSGHERGGMMGGGGGGGGGGSNVMSPSRYILVLKLQNTNSVLRIYPWVNRSHVSVNALCINSTVAQSFQIFEIG